MDETLLNDQHEICQRNVDAIIRAKKEFGVKFVPATGRGYLSIQHNLKTLGLYDEANEYVLSFNGGALTENRGNNLIQFKGLDFLKMKEIFEYGLDKDVCIRVYTKDQIFVFNLSESEAIRINSLKVPCNMMSENNVDFLADEPIAKILYQNLDIPYLKALEHKMKSITDGHCSVTYSSNRYMEFNALGVDKGQGLCDLVNILGLDIKDTIAVGDNYNDLAMLKVAGLSVAAQNATQDIKAVCDYTTKADNNEGVIAELIEKFIFNQ